MDFGGIAHEIATAFEAVGVGILTVGGLWSAGRFVRHLTGGQAGATAYRRFRQDLGRSILLGLEILVAADIIRTVAVEPSIENVTILGLIVLIRTFLSFSLEIETEGALPWRRGPAT